MNALQAALVRLDKRARERAALVEEERAAMQAKLGTAEEVGGQRSEVKKSEVSFRPRVGALLLKHLTLRCLTYITSHLTSPHLTAPHSHSTSQHLTAPHRTSPHLTAPHPTSSHLTAPYLALPCLTLRYVTSPTLLYLRSALPSKFAVPSSSRGSSTRTPCFRACSHRVVARWPRRRCTTLHIMGEPFPRIYA